MPIPDGPPSRFSSRRTSRVLPPLDTPQAEIERLKAELRQAKRLAEMAIKERDALRLQMIRAGIRPKTGPKKRKPPEAGIAVPAVPPRGPLPKQGGAEAPLEFDE